MLLLLLQRQTTMRFSHLHSNNDNNSSNTIAGCVLRTINDQHVVG